MTNPDLCPTCTCWSRTVRLEAFLFFIFSFLFFSCRKITDKATDPCHGVSFLECLVQGCTFVVLCFIGGLTAADHRRRNHGKVLLTDLKTFQVIEKDTWKTHRARKPSAVSLWAAEMKSSLLQRPGAYSNPHPSQKNWSFIKVKVECQVRYVRYVIGLGQKRATCQIQREGKQPLTLQSFSLLLLFWYGNIDKRKICIRESSKRAGVIGVIRESSKRAE